MGPFGSTVILKFLELEPPLRRGKLKTWYNITDFNVDKKIPTNLVRHRTFIEVHMGARSQMTSSS